MLILTIGVGIGFALHQLPIIHGYASKIACTCKYLQQRSVGNILIEDLGFFPVNLSTIKILEGEQSVEASLWSWFPQKATYHPGLGCALTSKNSVAFDSQTNSTAEAWDFESRSEIFSVASEITNLLENKEDGHRALLVIKDDLIIYEWYAGGFDRNTPQLGWSMTKSLMNAALGIYLKSDTSKIHENNLFPEIWNDHRSKITLSHLLRMNSGLSWTEKYDLRGPATEMLFYAADIASIPLHTGMEAHLSKNHWEYSSGTTNLLSYFLKSKIGSIPSYLHFTKENLFDKLGMTSAIIEPDAMATLAFSSFGYMTPRDWAKFGRLYLGDGNWNGSQILSSDWIEMTKKQAAGSDGAYGAHFWLNSGRKAFPNLPEDAYAAQGYQGQYLIIVPSHDLIIVRMGIIDTDMEPIFKLITTNVRG